ncbi:MAG TPA: hypothetical protein VFS08_09855 [Gemmatimonadaceae bacterium]|nr:hypothetical protein [Gemmatimonadaceae bacterium]
MSSPSVPPPGVSSPDVAAARAEEPQDARENAAGVRALLDTAFGYFVWAAHFLVVYIATAVSCQLGLGTAGARTRTTFLAVLALVTVAAVAIVALHTVRRYRRQRELPERRFRMAVTIGNDAIAAVAIAWQLLAIALVPLCA